MDRFLSFLLLFIYFIKNKWNICCVCQLVDRYEISISQMAMDHLPFYVDYVFYLSSITSKTADVWSDKKPELLAFRRHLGLLLEFLLGYMLLIFLVFYVACVWCFPSFVCLCSVSCVQCCLWITPSVFSNVYLVSAMCACHIHILLTSVFIVFSNWNSRYDIYWTLFT